MGSSPRILVRTLAGSAVASLLLSLAVVAPPASAATPAQASQSAFCKALIAIPKSKPSTNSYTSFRAWSKRYLPYWQKVASTAPNASTRAALSKFVSALKIGSKVGTAAALDGWVTTHAKEWSAGWTAYAKALVSCYLPSL
jgi:hypothetical protein